MQASKEELDNLAKELERVYSDFTLFCTAFLHINTKEEGKQPLQPNNAQLIVIDLLFEMMREKGYVKAVILKARQMGISTIIQAIFYFLTTTLKGVKTEVISHEKDSAEHIFSMTDTFYFSMPEELQPSKLRTRAGKSLTFDTADGKGLGSSYIVKTADVVKGSRSLTIHNLHASEVAFWRDAIELMKGLMQTVPKRKSWAVVESTAKGVGGYFHSLFVGAVMGTNDWLPIFLPWYIHEEYKEPFDNEQHLEFFIQSLDTTERYHGEKDLLREHKACTVENLKWRRYHIDNYCNGDLKVFHEEYPSTWREAFITSGKHVFDMRKLEEMLLNLQSDPHKGERGRLEYIGGDMGKVKFVPDPIGKLVVYEHPVLSKRYHSAFDVARGIKGGDFSAGGVVDEAFDDMCVYHGHTDPLVFADDIRKIGIYYNWHMVVPEANKDGYTVVSELRQTYSNLYQRRKGQDRKLDSFTGEYGFDTNRKTKPLIIARLQQLIREGTLGIREEESIMELMQYVEHENGTLGAEEGCFDDRVIWRAICYFTAKFEGRSNMDSVYHNYTRDFIVEKTLPIGGDTIYRSWSFRLGGISALCGYRTPEGSLQVLNEYNFFGGNKIELFKEYFTLTNEAFTQFVVVDVGDDTPPCDENWGGDPFKEVNVQDMDLYEREFPIRFHRSPSDHMLKIARVEDAFTRSYKGVPGILISKDCVDLINGFDGKYQIMLEKDGDIRDKLSKDKYASIHNALQNMVAYLDETKFQVVAPVKKFSY